MGPPPKWLIQRKLIKSIVTKVVPQRPLIPDQYFSALINCWKNFGIGSSKCSDQQLMFNFANTEVISFKERMEDLGLKEMVMAEVKRPVYHSETKGRFYGYRRKFKEEINILNHLN